MGGNVAHRALLPGGIRYTKCPPRRYRDLKISGLDLADTMTIRQKVPMSIVQLPPVIFESPPFFSSHWLGRHPHDRLPRVVECFGPSIRDDHAAAHGAVLGLKWAMSGKSPTLSRVSAEFDGQRLVLYSKGRELMRTDLLPLALATVLQWRAEVLLVWVDVPLQDPRTEISQVGLQHVWTGIAPVDGGEPCDLAPPHEVLAAGSWGASSATSEGLTAGPTATTVWPSSGRWAQPHTSRAAPARRPA